MTLRCAIYCTVIDNFGDVGVCWRLARQLAHEYEMDVVLWVDDLASFSKLAPTLEVDLFQQKLDQITVCLWQENDLTDIREHFDLVIEGFGCRLPDAMINRMAKQSADGQPPFWINLEYLSAEAWVIDCHAMPSTHPQTGLIQYFWFPSFYAQSGGLIREASLFNRYLDHSSIQSDFWSALGIGDAMHFDRRISLFAYENVVITHLLSDLVSDHVSTLLLIPMSKALTIVSKWVGRDLEVGDRITFGALTVAVLPFMNHTDYDQLLWACDLNIVRGEDSFIRAQWSGKPLLWQIYPQEDDAHLLKLDAFVDYVTSNVDIHPSWRQAMSAWNDANTQDHLWTSYLAQLPNWTVSAYHWQKHLTKQSDLARRLMHFFSKMTAKS
ncbi:elongation factor P maturation arginine rhamnosyltransferase EarP [Aquirhabdus sp.]|uniref:elongation factor P maturation arginine rhamnosyltransferase EarP n=1 Tax=Aquirhabdus sp. TaxID=2824160 RepID=UPI00396C6BAD